VSANGSFTVIKIIMFEGKKPGCLAEKTKQKNSKCSSSTAAAVSSKYGVGPLVDPFQSHISRSLCHGLPWFLLPIGL
jgi:hypothetical protein